MGIHKVVTLLMKGRAKEIEAAVQRALTQGYEAEEILSATQKAMDQVGQRYTQGACYIPDVLLSAQAANNVIAVIRPLLPNKVRGYIGKAVIGTVTGDYHDVGKNMIAMLLEAEGFSVYNLGEDVSAERFFAAAENDPDVSVIACSASLKKSLPALQKTVAAINAAPWRNRVRILVGGSAVTKKFADKIGADGYSADAVEAVRIAKAFVLE